jgi:dimethylargininase
MFTHVIVRRPSRSIVNGITSANLGKPNYEKALEQHDNYIEALKKCGVRVTIMDANEKFPDSVFIEDTAVLSEKVAIITNPGDSSRKGEEASVKDTLKGLFKCIETIKEPGTLEGGDVMKVGDHFYVGLSERTNPEGARQFADIVEKFGYASFNVPMEKVLHLKTGLAYLENNNLVVAGEFINLPVFEKFNKIISMNLKATLPIAFGLMILFLFLRGIKKQRKLSKKLIIKPSRWMFQSSGNWMVGSAAFP